MVNIVTGIFGNKKENITPPVEVNDTDLIVSEKRYSVNFLNKIAVIYNHDGLWYSDSKYNNASNFPINEYIPLLSILLHISNHITAGNRVIDLIMFFESLKLQHGK